MTDSIRNQISLSALCLSRLPLSLSLTVSPSIVPGGEDEVFAGQKLKAMTPVRSEKLSNLFRRHRWRLAAAHPRVRPPSRSSLGLRPGPPSIRCFPKAPAHRPWPPSALRTTSRYRRMPAINARIGTTVRTFLCSFFFFFLFTFWMYYFLHSRMGMRIMRIGIWSWFLLFFADFGCEWLMVCSVWEVLLLFFWKSRMPSGCLFGLRLGGFVVLCLWWIDFLKKNIYIIYLIRVVSVWVG